MQCKKLRPKIPYFYWEISKKTKKGSSFQRRNCLAGLSQ